ncbi:MAG TPA: ABC transporter permease [Candidatus Angelobacter sp.]|nr:ABC transporter permease [Candidatus Angelobacter sp.]
MIMRESRRFFRSSPLLSLSGTVVLALGIGVSSLALALILAFSSLTYSGMRSAGYATIAEETQGGGSVQVSWRRLDELRAPLGQGTTLATYSTPISTPLEAGGMSRKVDVSAISSGFFSVFTTRLSAGRDFRYDEESHTGKHVMILSSTLAVTLFESPANALGSSILLSGIPFEVVGVAPSGFHGMFGNNVDAWVPSNCVIPLKFNMSPGQHSNPDAWKEIALFYGVVASDRLSSLTLTATLSNLLPLRATDKTPLHVSQGLTADPVRDMKVRKWLRFGLLLAFIFTLVSSLNYCMLLLARAARSEEEVRLKKALGASGRQLVTELMIGPVAMVVAALAVACLLCAGGMMAIAHVSPFYEQLVRGSWHVALVAIEIQLLLAGVLTLIVALIPAIGCLRADTIPRMGYTATSRRTGSLLQIPVTVQIIFCVGSWILAGMIVASFLALMRVPLGYDPSHLSVVKFVMASNSMNVTSGHSTPEATALESFTDQLAAIPGVQSASYSDGIPFVGPGQTLEIQRLDRASTAPRTISETEASPNYFKTMGIHILQGQGFSPHGIGVEEIMVNQTLAKELWPDENPTNQSVRLIQPAYAGMPTFSNVARVVGVVEDLRLAGYAETPEPSIIASIYGANFVDMTPAFVVKGTVSAKTLQEVASRQGASYLPEYRLDSLDNVSEQAKASLSTDRQRTWCALAGAAIMAGVAYIGLFGALVYYVNIRRRELAVRVCLGASRWAIRKIVLMRAAGCAVAGLLLSLPLWPVLAHLSANDYLGRVSWSTGRAALIAMSCALVSVCVSLLPASSAASVSPSEVLKEQ